MIKRYILLFTLFTMCTLSAFSSAIAAEPEIVKIAYNTGVAPLKFESDDGDAAGLLPDTWRILGRKLGKEIEFVRAAGFDESLDMVKSGQADLHAGLFKTAEREHYLTYSSPLFQVDYFIFTNPLISPVSSLEDLSGIMVGLTKGGYTERVAKEKLAPEMLRFFDTYEQLFNAAVKGEVKAFIAQEFALLYYLSTKQMANIFHYKSNVPLYTQTYFTAASRSSPESVELVKQVNNAIANLSYDEINRLRDTWIHTRAHEIPADFAAILSDEERAYLSKKAIITVQNEGDWAPINFNDRGSPKGFSIDYLRLLGKKAGLDFRFVSGRSWDEYMEMVKKGELDLICNIVKSPEREQYLAFTSSPYISMVQMLYTRKGTPTVDGIEDLFGKRLAVPKGFYLAEQLIKYPGVHTVEVENSTDAVLALSRGKADAIYDLMPVVNYITDKLQITNLQIGGEINITEIEAIPMRIATRKDNPLLVRILDKAMQQVTDNEIKTLQSKWAWMPEKEKIRVSLSPEEKAWIKKHPEIMIAFDGNYPPYSYQNEAGDFVGIAIDFAKEIAQRTGIELRPYPKGVWKDLYAAALRHEVDVIATLVKRPEREEWFDFTASYISLSQYIITRNEINRISRRKDIRGERIALVEKYSTTRAILEEFPSVKPVYVKTLSEALEAVLSGRADATVAGMGMAQHLITRQALPNLKFAALYAKGLSDQCFGVRSDWPELTSILDKGLSSLSEKDRQLIFMRWTQPEIARAELVKPVHPLNLTEEEQAWLADHSSIRVAINNNWPPMDYVDAGGKAQGIGVEFIKALNERLGNRLEIVPGTWVQIYEGVKERRIDALMDITPKPERELYLNFTAPYVVVPHAIFAREGSEYFRTIKDLRGKKVGLERGFFIVKLLQENYPEVRVTEYDSTADALDGLAKGEVDAYIGNRAVAMYIIETELISNVRQHGKISETSSTNAIGVRKDWPMFRDILQKALASISSEKRQAILAASIHAEKLTTAVRFTTEEKKWLQAHKKVRVMVGTWPPFHSMEDGKPEGLALDYVTTILKGVGLEPEFVPISWGDALSSISKLDKIDLLPTIAYSDERAKLVNFTEQYLSFPYVIFTQKDAPFTGSLEDLHRKTVAVERNFIAHKLLQRDDPEINLHVVDTAKDALEAVSLGKADGYVGNLAVGSFLIEQQGFANLKVAGQTRYKSDIQSMGVRKDWPELASIINKYLAAIPDEQHRQLRQSALSMRFEHGTDIAYVRKVAFWVGGGITLVVLVIMFWNRRMAREIKERKRIQTELNKLSRAVEQSPAVVVITDKEGTITYVNPRFTEVTGYSFEEAVGRNPRILKSEKTLPSLYKELWETVTAGNIWRGEMINRIKSGEEIWESVSISPILSDTNEITHFVAVKEEITERKRMEQEIVEAKEKAEEATRAKSDFLANMSHEIRTPMNAIIGMSHLALKTGLTPKQHDYISKVQSSSNALLGIINDILDFSKIEAGKLDMESTRFQLEDVLNNLANLIGIKAGEKGLELLFNVDKEAPTALVGDPLRLGQILINLANNAVKFTETGEIIVSVSPVEKDESTVTMQFSVQDSGIGLTEEQRDKLFQAFAQADTSTTRKYGGTGLGLTISKKLCEMMGGEIRVDSVPGEGSTFIFTAIFGLHEEKTISLIPGPDLRGKRVLVVDDNQMSRQILHEMLESMTFEVTQTVSGEEALAEVSRADNEGFPYDVIYMDWQMPGLDGIATSKRIKEQNLSLQPRIIMVTAYGREDIMQQAENIKLEGFLVKPVNRSLLFDTTMQAFGREGVTIYETRIDKGEDNEALKDIRGARILLAEDNEINQQVAQEILEQAALVVEIANNGKEALEMARKNQYDAILMDIQMPEMGGFEATKAIREMKDPETSARHPAASLPIIAMTAHALAGDREKCLEGGMNDHVTKPINPDELFGALLKWIKPGEREIPKYLAEKTAVEAKSSEAQHLPQLQGIDVQTGLYRVGGYEDLYRSLLVKFYRKYPDTIRQIKDALDKEDWELSTRLAHTVKGVAAHLGATDLQAAGADVEAAITEGRLENIDELLETFEQNLQSVINGLKEFVAAEEAGGEKGEKEPGDGAKLAELLQELELPIQKKKPKPCKEAMAKIQGYEWPDDYRSNINELGRLINKYKFKDAQLLLESIKKNL
jgi:two-component system sensor histidine kinase/response regulator